MSQDHPPSRVDGFFASLSFVLFFVSFRVRHKTEEHPAGGVGDPYREDWLSRAADRLMAEDWMVFAYLVTLLAAVVIGTGARRPLALGITAPLLGSYVLLQAAAHKKPTRSRARETLRRVSLIVGVLGSFLELQYVLPTAT